ncbi:hypothetical protein [Streptomyces umbrinus]|uniref:hypothetical protein n=1 Tax=Streptomyces umbrinus TaxID=67370 RepID=UPI0033E4EBAC
MPRCTGSAEAAQGAEECRLRLPLKPARIRRSDTPLTPEEAGLREQLQRQVLDVADWQASRPLPSPHVRYILDE